MAQRSKRNFKFFFKITVNALLHIVLLLSYLTPRRRGKWVVGNSKGFNNNTKYFFLHAKEVLGKKSCYWISKNNQCRATVRALGFKAYHPASLMGLYHLLTASVYVYDMHLSSLNVWTRGRAKQVNLWHGVGIKNVEFKVFSDQPQENPFLDRLRHPASYVKPDMLLSTSPMMTRHFAECFRIPESRCVESSYPRCEIFSWPEEKLLSFIRRHESPETQALAERLKKSGRTYIYMPTWRVSRGKDFLREAGFDLDVLEKALEAAGALFLFKLHPFTKLKVDTSAYKHILFLDCRMDIYPLLPFTDVLITDYSSIYYDYLLIPGKEILLFPFDYEDYVATDHDLAFDFDEYTPGERVTTFAELAARIREGSHFANVRREWVTRQFWGTPETRRDLYEAIEQL